MTIKSTDYFRSIEVLIKESKLKLIAVVCFLLILVAFIIWISLDKTPPSADVSMHLQNSIEFQQYLKKGKIDNFIFAYKYYYPPLIYQLTALTYSVIGTSQHTAMLVFIPLLAIFFFSVFFIGATLHNDLTGLMAAVIASTFPFMTFMYREYFLDFPCTAFTALAIVFLIKSDFFKSKRFTLLFFIATGIGLLVKWSIIFFVFIPFIFTSYYCLKNSLNTKFDRNKFLIGLTAIIFSLFTGQAIFGYFLDRIDTRPEFIPSLIPFYILSLVPLIIVFFLLKTVSFNSPELRNILTGIMLCFLLCWHYYIPNFNQQLPAFFKYGFTYGEIEQDSRSISYFFNLIIFEYQGIAYSVFLFIGCLFYLISWKNNKNINILAIGIAASLIFLFILRNKDSRYFLPLTPLTASFAVYWISSIKQRFLKVSLIFLLMILSFCSSSLWVLPQFESLMKDKRNFALLSIPPDKTNWNLDKIADIVDQLVDSDKTMVIVKGGEKAQVSDSAFAYELIKKYPVSASIQRGEEWQKIIQVESYTPSSTVIVDIRGTENEENGDYLNFIIITVNKSQIDKDKPYYLAEKLQKLYDAKSFKHISNILLADGWIAHIYTLKRDDRNDD